MRYRLHSSNCRLKEWQAHDNDAIGEIDVKSTWGSTEEACVSEDGGAEDIFWRNDDQANFLRLS